LDYGEFDARLPWMIREGCVAYLIKLKTRLGILILDNVALLCWFDEA
jgi:hypothetical protein